jgi:hypothetical protein
MLREDVEKIIMGVIYTPDAKPRTIFTDGSKLEDKLALIDQAVLDVLQAVHKNEMRKINWWSALDVEHAVNQLKGDDEIDADFEVEDDFLNAVLDVVEDRFDAEYGTCWNDIFDATREVYADFKENQ